MVTNVFAMETPARRLAASMDHADEEALYRTVGDRVRAARERQPTKVSQVALAKKLDISRASIVNIEAGRQHAPLSLLWQIAEQLETELITLIPRKAELLAAPPEAELSAEMREKIRLKADGNEALANDLTSFIGQAVRQLTSVPNSTNPRKRKR
jgi:DNA-binding XRE family transcriptional regulator